MENQSEDFSSKRKKVILLFGVVAAGIALCAIMKNFICGKTGDICLCLGQSGGIAANHL